MFKKFIDRLGRWLFGEKAWFGRMVEEMASQFGCTPECLAQAIGRALVATGTLEQCTSWEDLLVWGKSHEALVRSFLPNNGIEARREKGLT